MVTIKTIAQEAGCSVSTVSKALNQRPDVSEETRQKVLQIAKKYHFYPNALGKGLKRKHTENIGVIFCREFQPLSVNPFYSRVLEGIEAELAINNYNLVLHLLPEVYSGEMPKMIREQQVDGLILIGVLQQEFIDDVANLKIPAILVDPKIPSDVFHQILIDNEHGAFEATQYLILKGHRRIAFISGDLERQSFRQRFEGYRKALQYHHIPFSPELVMTGGLEKGYDHVSALLDLRNPPTAIFAGNDINAIYGYRAVMDHHLSIPEDISIIGFDDIDLAKMASPPLTTMRVYKEELGSIAVRMLIKVIKEPKSRPNTIIVPVRLVERESVSVAPTRE